MNDQTEVDTITNQLSSACVAVSDQEGTSEISGEALDDHPERNIIKENDTVTATSTDNHSSESDPDKLLHIDGQESPGKNLEKDEALLRVSDAQRDMLSVKHKDTTESVPAEAVNADDKKSIDCTDLDEDLNDIATKETMKLEVEDNDGTNQLQVKKDLQAEGLPSTNSGEEGTITPTTKRKNKVKSKKGSTSTKSKTRVASTKQKSKGPKTPTQGKPQVSPKKPLMDLRSILQKHEKKTVKPDYQNYEKVDFYGSLSSIPFLTKKKVEEKPKSKSTTREGTKKKKTINPSSVSSQSHGDSESSLISVDAPEKVKLPTKEEITVTAEYDQAQLEMWKSMNALDNMHDSMERPQEMLPLRPGKRDNKKVRSPKPSGVRAFSRPEDWVNRPELRSPVKSYKPNKKISQEEVADILVMEPESPKV